MTRFIIMDAGLSGPGPEDAFDTLLLAAAAQRRYPFVGLAGAPGFKPPPTFTGAGATIAPGLRPVAQVKFACEHFQLSAGDQIYLPTAILSDVVEIGTLLLAMPVSGRPIVHACLRTDPRLAGYEKFHSESTAVARLACLNVVPTNLVVYAENDVFAEEMSRRMGFAVQAMPSPGFARYGRPPHTAPKGPFTLAFVDGDVHPTMLQAVVAMVRSLRHALIDTRKLRVILNLGVSDQASPEVIEARRRLKDFPGDVVELRYFSYGSSTYFEALNEADGVLISPPSPAFEWACSRTLIHARIFGKPVLAPTRMPLAFPDGAVRHFVSENDMGAAALAFAKYFMLNPGAANKGAGAWLERHSTEAILDALGRGSQTALAARFAPSIGKVLVFCRDTEEKTFDLTSPLFHPLVQILLRYPVDLHLVRLTDADDGGHNDAAAEAVLPGVTLHWMAGPGTARPRLFGRKTRDDFTSRLLSRIDTATAWTMAIIGKLGAKEVETLTGLAQEHGLRDGEPARLFHWNELPEAEKMPVWLDLEFLAGVNSDRSIVAFESLSALMEGLTFRHLSGAPFAVDQPRTIDLVVLMSGSEHPQGRMQNQVVQVLERLVQYGWTIVLLSPGAGPAPFECGGGGSVLHIEGTTAAAWRVVKAGRVIVSLDDLSSDWRDRALFLAAHFSKPIVAPSAALHRIGINEGVYQGTRDPAIQFARMTGLLGSMERRHRFGRLAYRAIAHDARAEALAKSILPLVALNPARVVPGALPHDKELYEWWEWHPALGHLASNLRRHLGGMTVNRTTARALLDALHDPGFCNLLARRAAGLSMFEFGIQSARLQPPAFEEFIGRMALEALDETNEYDLALNQIAILRPADRQVAETASDYDQLLESWMGGALNLSLLRRVIDGLHSPAYGSLARKIHRAKKEAATQYRRRRALPDFEVFIDTIVREAYVPARTTYSPDGAKASLNGPADAEVALMELIGCFRAAKRPDPKGVRTIVTALAAPGTYEALVRAFEIERVREQRGLPQHTRLPPFEEFIDRYVRIAA